MFVAREFPYRWYTQLLHADCKLQAGLGLFLTPHSDLDTPFAKWTKEQVCSWLAEQGLGSYLSSGKHWIMSGQTLLQASQQDLEKVLNKKGRDCV